MSKATEFYIKKLYIHINVISSVEWPFVTFKQTEKKIQENKVSVDISHHPTAHFESTSQLMNKLK